MNQYITCATYDTNCVFLSEYFAVVDGSDKTQLMAEEDDVRRKIHKFFTNTQLARKMTALMFFAREGKTSVLDRFKLHVRCRDNFGMTALMYASKYGHASCVEWLCKKECGMVNHDNHTALMLAQTYKREMCVNILLQYAIECRMTLLVLSYIDNSSVNFHVPSFIKKIRSAQGNLPHFK